MTTPSTTDDHPHSDATATTTPPVRASRADSPTWQRIEAIGKTYFRLSRRLAHLVAATKQHKP
jgi:hypothetical protein